MTRLPHDNWRVEKADGPKYKVGPNCCVPGCSRYADHAHHLWRRSFTGGPTDWLKLWDGRVVQNLVPLCFEHHDDITVNRAVIRMDDEAGFVWGRPSPVGFLDPQPRFLDELAVAHPEPAGQLVEEVCTSCGAPKRRPRVQLPPGERRPRKSWTISVPVDERENGADVLDTLLEECAKLLGRHEHASWRYFTLVETLALVVQNGAKLMDES